MRIGTPALRVLRPLRAALAALGATLAALAAPLDAAQPAPAGPAVATETLLFARPPEAPPYADGTPAC